jgi:hypothetical protein
MLMEISYHCPNAVERDRVRDFVRDMSKLLEYRSQRIASQQLTTSKVREQRDIAVKANTYLEISKLLLEINIASSEP